MLNNRIIYFLIIAGLIFIGGCSSYKAVSIKPDINLPRSFLASTDTNSAGKIPLHVFFKDQYLISLIDTAWNRNPDLLSAWQRIQMAKERLSYNKSLRLPSVDLSISAAMEKYGRYTMNGVGNYDTNLSPNINSDEHIPDPATDYFAGLRSSWEIDIWGKLKNAQKASLARLLSSQSGYQLVKTELGSAIANQYYQLLAYDMEAATLSRNIKLQENALEIVKIQKAGGRATELAVQQFAAQLSNTKALQFTNAQQIAEAENQLRMLTGRFSGPILRDTSILAIGLPQQLKTGVPVQMLLNRPDIRQAELDLVAMNADIRSARAAFFPTLTLTPYVGYNSFKTALLFNPSSAVFGIMGGLTAPLLNRRKIKADYNYKIAEGTAALYAYQKVVLNSYKEVMDHLQGMENYQRYIGWKTEEVRSLQQAVNVSNELYAVGRANYLEVITAQRNELNAELELAEARKNLYLNSVGLYQALGGGTQ